MVGDHRGICWHTSSSENGEAAILESVVSELRKSMGNLCPTAGQGAIHRVLARPRKAVSCSRTNRHGFCIGVRMSRVGLILIAMTLGVAAGCAGEAEDDVPAGEDAFHSKTRTFPISDRAVSQLSEASWAFPETVGVFQADKPADAVSRMSRATDRELSEGISIGWVQQVDEQLRGDAQPMAVEWTTKRIPVRYEDFVRAIPPARWGGANLANWVGGATRVVRLDEHERPVRQIERMVLSNEGFDVARFNNDMTKMEIVEYARDSAIVSWRVFYSDNGSTVSDIGSVRFDKDGESNTRVTFHSAHRLQLGGVSLKPHLAIVGLTRAFLAHANRYAEIVRASTP